MAIRIVVGEGLRDIPVFLSGLTEGPVRRAIARSIRRTLQGLRTETTKAIREKKLVNTTSLPIAEIKRRYLRERDRTSSSLPISEMEARLEFTDRHPSLFHFFAKRVATQYGYSSRGKARATQFGVHVTVFGRTFRAGRGFIPPGRSIILTRIGRGRYPLRKMFGPSFAAMVRGTGLDDDLQRSAQNRYGRELSSNLDYFLKRKK
jgi:hypothetical protein